MVSKTEKIDVEALKAQLEALKAELAAAKAIQPAPTVMPVAQGVRASNRRAEWMAKFARPIDPVKVAQVAQEVARLTQPRTLIIPATPAVDAFRPTAKQRKEGSIPSPAIAAVPEHGVQLPPLLINADPELVQRFVAVCLVMRATNAGVVEYVDTNEYGIEYGSWTMAANALSMAGLIDRGTARLPDGSHNPIQSKTNKLSLTRLGIVVWKGELEGSHDMRNVVRVSNGGQRIMPQQTASAPAPIVAPSPI